MGEIWVPQVQVYELPATVTGLSDDERDEIALLVREWQRKYPRNALRSVYFDAKMPLRPTRNIPREAMDRVRAVLGWPEKAVSVLAERSVFEGFVALNGTEDPFELSVTLEDNRFDLELPQAISSAYKHSCSFITTARGDTAAGEPDVLVMVHSAEWSAALWDARKREVRSFLAVTETEPELGRPVRFDVWLPHAVLSLRRAGNGRWVVERRENPLNEMLVEPLAFDPQLGRPFGRSRISRPVMNITDRALMTIVRTEIASDFYAVPRMFALGVSEDAFNRGKWQAAIDRWFAITRDENGDIPTVGQFPQMTMQPLVEQYKLYATQFSGETGVPVSNLGIITENPPSAEAIFADDRRLVSIAHRQNRIFSSSLKRVAQRIVMLRDGRTDLTSELRGISCSWANPAFTSPAVAADALVKLNQVFPWLGQTQVALEFAGFSQSEIRRLLADKQRAQGAQLVEALLSSRQPSGGLTPEAQAAPREFPSGDELV